MFVTQDINDVTALPLDSFRLRLVRPVNDGQQNFCNIINSHVTGSSGVQQAAV
jgi:hypothetical protein